MFQLSDCNLHCILSFRRRRLASKRANEGNSHEAHGPSAYEMISGDGNSQPVYASANSAENRQSGSSAPAESTSATQPSAPSARSSLHDVTLIDNALYSK